jgi:ATP-dependent protease ClpP protease subunit
MKRTYDDAFRCMVTAPDKGPVVTTTTPPTTLGSGLAAASGVTMHNNNIYFRADVNEHSVNKLVDLISDANDLYFNIEKSKRIKKAEPNPIYLHITSYGGSVFECFRAVNHIKSSVIPIHTVIDGYAASSASLMSVVGVKRYMRKNSYVLIHQLSSGMAGKYWEIRDEYKTCRMLMHDIYKIYEEHTKMSRAELEKYLSHDCWWKQNRCKREGIIDGIFEDIDKEEVVVKPPKKKVKIDKVVKVINDNDNDDDDDVEPYVPSKKRTK